ncbi:MAG: hypothetical protein ABEJ85_03150, partial [Haloarculaceae archaeon]
MSERTLSREQWADVVDEASPATFGEIVATLEERDYVPGDPSTLVEDAIADGPLVEAADSGAFPVYAVEEGGTGPQYEEEPAEGDANPTPDADASASSHSDSGVNAGDEVAAALEDAIEFFHDQLDREADFPQADVDTPRDYFREVRGWDDETIDAKRLGWAPASRSALLDHLMGEGYDRDALLGTGLFWENGLAPIWQGRLVFPYLVDGRPAFAISRRVGDEGHPADDAGAYGDDDVPAKYHKVPGQDCAEVEEPIYGVDSLEDGADVLITEGIADAITAHA